MAISITTGQAGHFGFIINATSADASGVEVLLAGVAGKSIVLDHLTVNSTDAVGISIGEGETVPGTIDDVLIGPIAFPALQTLQWDFRNGGMKLTTTMALVVEAGAGNINVFCWGRIE